ncbi:UNKNOWN [Stylonychia lemnae]|uniref:Uncharacterized protein n=1 Tax=Stylonychia lemnae TaxID=5949 RepID=A0A078AE59_STYLE|nr:UNKNOWN [Stylonychia lemnae]|eukprot:CDW80544.1 UNKNOWN [Stylonychia lemnae]
MLEMPKRLASQKSNLDANFLFRLLSSQSTRYTLQEPSQYTRYKTIGSFLGVKECLYCDTDASDSVEIRNLLMLCATKATIQQEFYNVKNINNILYNRQVHLVSVFKDYLIYDDICEFITAYYNIKEAKKLFGKLALNESEKQQQAQTIAFTPNYHNLELKHLLL